MAAYQTIMKIGGLQDQDGNGAPLYTDSMEVEGCSYAFDRGVSHKGEPQTEIVGGAVTITYLGLLPKPLHPWLLKANKRKNVRAELRDAEEI
ncbi:MAG: hypothetical protein LBN24_10920 [Mediterranea sp.]|jgi:hypothetical protein|nr:hypothetical protein [Mediterranea sp.]